MTVSCHPAGSCLISDNFLLLLFQSQLRLVGQAGKHGFSTFSTKVIYRIGISITRCSAILFQQDRFTVERQLSHSRILIKHGRYFLVVGCYERCLQSILHARSGIEQTAATRYQPVAFRLLYHISIIILHIPYGSTVGTLTAVEHRFCFRQEKLYFR